LSILLIVNSRYYWFLSSNAVSFNCRRFGQSVELCTFIPPLFKQEPSPLSNIDWKQIKTVLLDMDGTLLDLHFDNHFWLEHLPKKLAALNGITLDAARAFMMAEYSKVEGTINWYCLDYWSQKLNIDIVQAKREIEHLISLRPDALVFIDALKQSGREVILLTNAHPHSLSLKVEHTQLDSHIDKLISTHQFGVTKESQLLWQKLQHEIGFASQHTLFVDDSLTILQAAKDFGIKYLMAVSNPDSQRSQLDTKEFVAVHDYRLFIPEIMQDCYSRSE
jgi:putative hydrolase of the HAD superfamily